jgi:hypothetical protein
MRRNTALDDWDEDLEAQLRRDAATWRAAPSPEVAGRLHAAIAALPSTSRSGQRRTVRAAVAAAAIAVLVSVLVWTLSRPGLPEPRGDSTPAVTLDDALEPLEREFAALTDDTTTLAAAVWEGVPRPLRRLLEE